MGQRLGARRVRSNRVGRCDRNPSVGHSPIPPPWRSPCGALACTPPQMGSRSSSAPSSTSVLITGVVFLVEVWVYSPLDGRSRRHARGVDIGRRWTYIGAYLAGLRPPPSSLRGRRSSPASESCSPSRSTPVRSSGVGCHRARPGCRHRRRSVGVTTAAAMSVPPLKFARLPGSSRRASGGRCGRSRDLLGDHRGSAGQGADRRLPRRVLGDHDRLARDSPPRTLAASPSHSDGTGRICQRHRRDRRMTDKLCLCRSWKRSTRTASARHAPPSCSGVLLGRAWWWSETAWPQAFGALDGYLDECFTDRLGHSLAVTRPGFRYHNLGIRMSSSKRSSTTADAGNRGPARCGRRDRWRQRVLGRKFDGAYVKDQLDTLLGALAETGADIITIGLFDLARSRLVPPGCETSWPPGSTSSTSSPSTLCNGERCAHRHAPPPTQRRSCIYADDRIHCNARGHAIAFAALVTELAASVAGGRLLLLAPSLRVQPAPEPAPVNGGSLRITPFRCRAQLLEVHGGNCGSPAVGPRTRH